MLSSVTLDEKSYAACAVTSWRDQLYVAWTGTDLFLNVTSSPGWGVFAGKKRLAQRSYKQVTNSSSDSSSSTQTIALPPSMAGFGERLYLAWPGTDRALNVLGVEPGAGSSPAKLKERSTESPSLTTSGQGRLTLAWIGTDRHVNLVKITEDWLAAPSRPEQAKNRLEQAKSSCAPAVCSHHGRLILAWTGTDRRVNILTDAQDPSRPPIRLEQAKSSCAPAVCSHHGRLILAWTGTDRRVNILTDAQDPSRPPIRLEQAKSSCAPAVCSHHGNLILAWTGTDRRPNLGRVQ